MTAGDAFDARLKAMFAEAEPQAEDAFVERVLAKLSGPNRKRLYLVGGAGAGGSTIASVQLENLFQDIAVPADAPSWLGDAAGLLAYAQPETLAAVTLAVMVAAFAFILPSRS